MAKDDSKLIADQAKEIAKLKAQLKSKEDAEANISGKQLDLNRSLTDSMNRQLEIKEEIAKVEDLARRAAIQKQKMEEQGNHDLFVKFKKIERNKKAQLEILKAEHESLRIADDQTKKLQQHTKLLKERVELGEKYADTFSNSLSILDDIESEIKKIPIVGDFLSKAMGIDGLKEKLVDKFKDGWTETTKGAGETADVIGGIPGEVNNATKSTKGLGLGLGKVLGVAMAVGAVVELFKFALQLDQEMAEMARGLGISKDAALGINIELNKMAATSKVVGASGEAFRKEYQEVAKALGVSKLANAEMAETQVYLNKQLGMASDEAANFQSMSMATGRTAYQNLAVIKEGVKSMTGGLMSYTEVANDIAKSSKSVQASYKGNIAALVKATITAKKFGMTLDETKKSADAILDIESSVEAEMKANVLTGKHMNLNAARQLALQGKSAEAVEEMMTQAGGYDELMDMAPYKQKAVAEAMGMSVDEMIKAAEHQKNLNTMADELGITLDKNGKMSEEDMQRALSSNNEEAKKLALQQQQASVQEQLATQMENIKATFASIASGPLGTLMSGIASILQNATAMKGILTAVAVILAGMAISAIASMSALTLGIGLVAVTAGIAAAAAATNAERDKAQNAIPQDDAIIGPDGGLVVSGTKGTYKLNKDDSIVAGTDLLSSDSRLGNTSTSSQGLGDVGTIFKGNQDTGNREVISLLKELIAKVEQPVKINISGRVIEELESQASMRRSYNTKIDGAYGANG